jgi:O-6-methylguanine DNA methyltransferase
MIQIFYTILPSPQFVIGLAATSNGLCRLEIGMRSESRFIRLLEKEYGSMPVREDVFFDTIKKLLSRYWTGEPTEFDLKLDLSLSTPFQAAVWKTLRMIPYGETRSYDWIAEQIGRPSASRAVGRACGRNRLPILIPCHRVIRKDGSLGGYTGGLTIKKRLLKLEERQ